MSLLSRTALVAALLRCMAQAFIQPDEMFRRAPEAGIPTSIPTSMDPMAAFKNMASQAGGDNALPTMQSMPKMPALSKSSKESTDPWPKAGQAHRPTASEDDLPPTSGLRIVVIGAVVLGAMGALGGVAYNAKTRRDGPLLPDADQEPLLGALRASQPSSLFIMHLRALGTATYWRHMHTRAIWMHVLRVAIPGAFLFLMHMVREYVADYIHGDIVQGALQLGGSSGASMTNSVLDFTFSVTVLFMVMMSMIFFVRQASTEGESGLRHLLHVSGLSRWAYLLATIGLDGYAVTMFGLLGLVVFADVLLQLRLVMWTSPLLLLLMLSTLVSSVLSSGYLLCIGCSSSRQSTMIVTFLVMILLIVVPLSTMGYVIGANGTGWFSMLLPTIPAYRGLFELVASCHKGRCVVMSDVNDAIREGKAASVWQMLFGSSQVDSINEGLTPPAALLSFLGLALFLMAMTCALAIYLDMAKYPSIKNARAQLSGSAVLQMQDVRHHYGWGPIGTKAQVLKGVNLTVNAGEVVGMLGPNGAGKTTCIRCVVGEETPSLGTVAVNSNMKTGLIGFCPQETVIIEDLTVAENLLIFAYVRGISKHEAARCLESMLIAGRLQEKRDWMPDTLSGGMRRRLAVTCALIGAPAVAILDEPTTGLDPMTRRGIWNTIQENKLAGSCCLLTTHMLEEAEALCSSIVVLRKGEIAAQGSVQELKEKWGNGYFLNIDSKPGEQEKAKAFVASWLPEYLTANSLEESSQSKPTPMGK